MKEEPLHILQLPSFYIPNGGQFVTQQAQILKDKGLIVNILSNIELGISVEKWKYFTYFWCSKISHEDGLTVFRSFFRSVPKLTKLNAKLYARKTLRLFGKYVKMFGKPDIIHVHSAMWAGYAAYLIKQKYGVPYIITEHRARFSLSCDYAAGLFADWQTPYYEKAFSNASFIIPVSINIQPKIESFLIRNVPISPLSNVLDTDYFHYRERVKTDKIKFIATNGFYYYKGYDILFPAFDSACEANPNIEITIAGGHFEGKDFDTIWNNVKNKEKFHFAGDLSSKEVRNELWKADIFVLPSRVESQSISTLEALSTGLPVVVTTVVPKIMTTTENSLVVPVENVNALRNAMLEMAKNYQNYNGKAISEHIKTVAGREAITNRLIEIYKQVLKTE